MPPCPGRKRLILCSLLIVRSQLIENNLQGTLVREKKKIMMTRLHISMNRREKNGYALLHSHNFLTSPTHLDFRTVSVSMDTL